MPEIGGTPLLRKHLCADNTAHINIIKYLRSTGASTRLEILLVESINLLVQINLTRI